MSDDFSRGTLLLQQGKLDMAEQALRQSCVQYPQESMPHAMLALCLSMQNRHDEATEEAERSVHLGPDEPFSHCALAQVLGDRNRLKEARVAIATAVELDPHDSDNWGILAGIELRMNHWKEALDAAEKGLSIDAEDSRCAHVRSIALMKLGRAGEAIADTARTLSQDPDDATAHANQGWAMLEIGDNCKALEHFSEALRLDPESEWARTGMVTALKARNPVYRLMLNYFLWMSKLSGKMQWGLIIGAYIVFRLVRSVAANNEAWKPYITPILFVYIGFVLLTWLTDPLFNLLLRLDKFGRHALSDDQRKGANLTGLCLLAIPVGIVLGFITLSAAPFIAAASALFLLVPCSSIYRCDRGWPRMAMAAYAGAMALAGVGATVAFGFGYEETTTTLLAGLILGAVGSFWVANILASITVRQ